MLKVPAKKPVFRGAARHSPPRFEQGERAAQATGILLQGSANRRAPPPEERHGVPGPRPPTARPSSYRGAERPARRLVVSKREMDVADGEMVAGEHSRPAGELIEVLGEETLPEDELCTRDVHPRSFMSGKPYERFRDRGEPVVLGDLHEEVAIVDVFRSSIEAETRLQADPPHHRSRGRDVLLE